ncbi:MAG: hypothetical protein ABIP07_08665, partial [Sphingomicrobium sp.]
RLIDIIVANDDLHKKPSNSLQTPGFDRASRAIWPGHLAPGSPSNEYDSPTPKAHAEAAP